MPGAREGQTDSWNVILGALSETLERLERSERAPESRSLMIEARRLRSIVAMWDAVPPSTETRREMLTRVLDLASRARTTSPASDTSPVLGPISAPTSSSPPLESGPVSTRLNATTPPVEEERPPIPPKRSATAPSLPAVHAPTLPAPPGPGARPRPLRGFTSVNPERLESQQVPGAPGVRITPLHRDATGAVSAALLHMRIGSRLPAAVKFEHLLVLDGSVRVGGRDLGRGECGFCEPDAIVDVESRASTVLWVSRVEGAIAPR